MSLDALTAPAIASLVALVAAAVALTRLYLSSRRAIVFDAWTDFARRDGEGDRGKSLADLLLFEIRAIQNAHQRSRRALDLTNPYDDIPAFQQELDADLTAAVELQRESRFVGPVVSLLMALMPVRPARLRGSVHRFGEELRVNVVLEQPRRGRRSGAPQWSGTRSRDDDLPALIEELAYEVYLTLADSAVFADPIAFRLYTKGLEAHVRYGDLSLEGDRQRAEELYGEALRREPRNPAALYNLAVLHYYMFEEARNRQAEDAFRRALPAARGALLAQIHSGLANVHSTKYHRFRSGDPEDLRKAVHHGEEALRVDDGLDVALKAVAYAHHQSSEAAQDADAAAEHRERAVTYYQKAIDANPRYYIAHNNFGNLYLGLAQSVDDRRAARELLLAAVALFKETMAIRPSYHHAYDNLGNAYYELARLGDASLLEDAARSYRDALRIKPDYAEAKNDLAMLHLTPGWKGYDEQRARALHEEALAAVPDENRRRELERAFRERAEPAAVGGGEPARPPADARQLARRARRHRRRRRLALAHRSR